MQSGREDTLEERYAIKFCFKVGKSAIETYGMLQTAFGASCMNRSSVFERHKRFKEDRLSKASTRPDPCPTETETETAQKRAQSVYVT